MSKTLATWFTVLMCILFTVSAFAAVQSYTLEWDPNSEPDLAGYSIHWGETQGGPYPNQYDVTADHTTVTLNGLENEGPGFQEGKTYYFVATAFDTGGLRSGYSNEVAAVVPDLPPDAPQGLTIKVTVELNITKLFHMNIKTQ
jgi:hypothetical protein